MRQLPLDLDIYEQTDFATFVPGQAEAVVAALQRLAAEGGEQIVLWGAAAVGKTHLLQAVCHAAAKRAGKGMYLPLRQLVNAPAGILTGLAEVGLVCVDDLHTVIGDLAWELALVELIDIARLYRHGLVLALQDNPVHLHTALPDLGSRLIWGTVFNLVYQDDATKQAILQQYAKRRGFELSTESTDYLLSRYPRDLHSQIALLAKIDRASLSEQRRVTVPFIKGVLPPQTVDPI